MSEGEQLEWRSRMLGSSKVEVCPVHHGLNGTEPTRVIALVQTTLNQLLSDTGAHVRVVERRSGDRHDCATYPYALPPDLWDRILAEATSSRD